MSIEVDLRVTLGSFELNFSASTDRTLAVIGPNGAGKSTLLHALLGLRHLTRGSVKIGSRVLADAGQGVHVPIEQRGIGYVPQGYGLFGHMTVTDNVGFGLRAAGARDADARINETIERFDLGPLAYRKPQELSGGERQRVALARALALEPALLLLDEPMAALDVRARSEVRETLASHLRSSNCQSVIVTHDVRDLAVIDPMIVVLEDGCTVQSGGLDELRTAPATPFVREFVGAVV